MQLQALCIFFVAIGEFKLELESGNNPIWVKFDAF